MPGSRAFSTELGGLYGHVDGHVFCAGMRPKVVASEPSDVTIARTAAQGIWKFMSRKHAVQSIFSLGAFSHGKARTNTHTLIYFQLRGTCKFASTVGCGRDLPLRAACVVAA